MKTETLRARAAVTLESEAHGAVNAAAHIYAKWFPKRRPDPADEHAAFKSAILNRVLAEEPDPDEILAGYLDSEEAGTQLPSAWDFLVLMVANAVRALREGELGERTAGWTYVMDANYLEGKLEGVTDSRKAMSLIGRRGGLATQAESKAMREDVRAWCESRLDQYQSLNKLSAAANEAKLAPSKPLTVRSWITEWAKEWRRDGRWKD